MPESILLQLTPDSITVHGQRKAEYIRPFPGSHSSSSSSSSNSNSNSNKLLYLHDRIILQYLQKHVYDNQNIKKTALIII